MLLVGNGRLITRDNNIFYENGAVAIEGNTIKEVGDLTTLKAKYSQALCLQVPTANIFLVQPPQKTLRKEIDFQALPPLTQEHR